AKAVIDPANAPLFAGCAQEGRHSVRGFGAVGAIGERQADRLKGPLGFGELANDWVFGGAWQLAVERGNDEFRARGRVTGDDPVVLPRPPGPARGGWAARAGIWSHGHDHEPSRLFLVNSGLGGPHLPAQNIDRDRPNFLAGASPENHRELKRGNRR